MTDLASLVTAFTALFVVIDPIGLTPLFVALTPGMTPARRRGIAIRACAVALAILTLFALFGEALLGFLGISMPAFRIAGGILLFVTALDMLFERRQKRRQGTADAEETDAEHDDPSVFPLAIPLIAGPGAIATMILLAERADGVAGYAAMFAVLAVVLGLVLALFLSSGLLERGLGATGINVVTRLLGMLLAALSVQFVIDGIRASGFGG
ncbi:MAG: multiple antibiotic resistance protein [Rhodobacteraceae bacterium HLUCCA08]|nr:MAG: multiple antibiotic resistance protein [Rhodobacteraceae bacterium HLUCCA08]